MLAFFGVQTESWVCLQCLADDSQRPHILEGKATEVGKCQICGRLNDDLSALLEDGCWFIERPIGYYDCTAYSLFCTLLVHAILKSV
jgi:hypothetical protein